MFTDKLKDYLLIHELPVLDILRAVLSEIEFEDRHSMITKDARDKIVLTYGRALKTALDMKREEANAARNDHGGDGDAVSALRGDAPEADNREPGRSD